MRHFGRTNNGQLGYMDAVVSENINKKSGKSFGNVAAVHLQDSKFPLKFTRICRLLNATMGYQELGFARLSGNLRMTGAKFDIEKFDGTGDFGLWRIKMRALLIQHGCEAALEVLPGDMEAEAKAELNKKAHS
ncbi:hypothetical protein Tco_0117009 [Tanacetum coccineum]